MSDDDEAQSPWALPRTEVEFLGEEPSPGPGFLRLRRLTLKNRYADGTESASYVYDVVERSALDAVVLLLWGEVGGDIVVCLRSSLRPPLLFRGEQAIPFAHDGSVFVWEIPAGLIEPGEKGEAGVRACAARETMEETGFDVAAEDFELLGPPMYLSPGVLAEQIHYLAAQVDPDRRGVPTEDGSPVEENALVRFVPLREALAAVDEGLILDVKTEAGLRRLASALDGRRLG